jgi:hypothetical protein
MSRTISIDSGAILVSVYRGAAAPSFPAEVSLAERKRVPQAPGLHQSDEGVVNRRVAVGVELAHDLADNAGALVEALVGTVSPVVHRVDNAAVHRLEAIANVRKGAPHDDTHRIVEVRALHLKLEVDLVDLVVTGIDHCVFEGGLGGAVAGLCFVSHVSFPSEM